jgi:hypothetical protein
MIHATLLSPKDCQGSLIIYITGAVGLLAMAYIPVHIDRVSIVCMRDIGLHVQTADVFLTRRLENIGVPPPSIYVDTKAPEKNRLLKRNAII